MKLLDLTLASPAENLALDEALLDAAEASPNCNEVFRLWQPASHFVVVGRSSIVGREVHIDACRRRGVPILRRASGGAAIVAGPGCLMYAVVLSYERHPGLRMLDRAHAHVLGQVAEALRSIGIVADLIGTSDLAVNGCKVSGNSLRSKRDHFLYHGTLLYDFDKLLVDELLQMPPRAPDYRAAREHGRFLTNLPVSGPALEAAMAMAFAANEPLLDWPRSRTSELVATRYGLDEWNLRH